ncbi:hypothetical protein T459_09378 [Capsicum annuum]|uniref:Uncharacterized protein n=1 Tax=Capsicum annuum TaxID=4072 RepID=A0A2G2ZZ63_CAPAN|nr:hypothetical protein T459_09378 [Capsicum annuum]
MGCHIDEFIVVVGHTHVLHEEPVTATAVDVIAAVNKVVEVAQRLVRPRKKAWAFEVIPYLRQQVNYQEGVFCPRILRWLSVKTDKNVKFLDLFNPSKDAIVHLSLVSTNREFNLPFFLTLLSVQTLSDPKVIDRIKIKLFGATAITRKIILEGGLIVVDGLSGDGAVGGRSGAAVGANDAPLIVFKANHYEYDHTGYTDCASPSECSTCKCQDCRAKHDVVINAINALTASVKELTSKRGLIPSKRILFLSTPLEIRAKRRRRVISRALSSIQKSKIKSGGCDYFDWYEERHPSQANRVIWGLWNKVKDSEEKQNRARRYYIVVIIATDLMLLGTWIFKPNC